VVVVDGQFASSMRCAPLTDGEELLLLRAATANNKKDDTTGQGIVNDDECKDAR
jgi:hypothetical protein